MDPSCVSSGYNFKQGTINWILLHQSRSATAYIKWFLRLRSMTGIISEGETGRETLKTVPGRHATRTLSRTLNCRRRSYPPEFFALLGKVERYAVRFAISSPPAPHHHLPRHVEEQQPARFWYLEMTSSTAVSWTIVNADESSSGTSGEQHSSDIQALRNALEKGNDDTKIQTMQKILVIMLNGDPLPGLLMHVIRFVFPLWTC
jgi:hypothetical protein